jgi:hypothetical protein
MLSVLQTGLQQGNDVRFNILPSYAGIKAKVFAESKLGVDPKVFTSFGREHQSPDVNHMYEAKLRELEQEGFGARAAHFLHGPRM